MQKEEKGKGISYIETKNIDKYNLTIIISIIFFIFIWNMGEFTQIRAERQDLIKGLPSVEDVGENGIQRDYGNSFFGLGLLPREAYRDDSHFQKRLLDKAQGLKSMAKYHERHLFSQSDVVAILSDGNSALKKSLFEEIDVIDIIEALNNNVNKFRELGIEIKDSRNDLNMDLWYADDCQSRHRLYDLRVRQNLILDIKKETRTDIKLDIDRILNTDVSALINSN